MGKTSIEKWERFRGVHGKCGETQHRRKKSHSIQLNLKLVLFSFSQVLIALSKNLAKYIVVCMVYVDEVAPTSTSFMLCFE